MLTADELYAATGIEGGGTIAWDEDVPTNRPGVYIISVDTDPATVAFRAEADEAERARWFADEVVVYIGRATSLRRRLRQFRRHRYGDRAPHRGGQAILLLDCAKIINWAEVADFHGAEDRLLRAFVARVGRMPYGNRARAALPKVGSRGFAAMDPIATAQDVTVVG